ncbi:MAG: tRNA pseudouridine(38-40) synthase TruA [Desulfotomaculaceae bacterium]|nr:tRNA pseudouridine(38-40) synthase TruA [Desulfotomaculaceae bacterium]MDD4767145.1 tRNA pseudouridine(38-40) synthase TruA [Desulfotomaculaceae bacterium]
MANIKVTIAYDGTNYHGFQEQRGTSFMTIQGVFEESLSRLAKKEIRVVGAGRTDAGVHACGQVVNFESEDLRIPPERLTYALNSVLPADIIALEAAVAPASFHSRFSAAAKTYRYVIYNGKMPSPFLRFYSYHLPCALDLEAMRDGARSLVGKQDFSAFRALGTPVKTTVRSLFGIEVSKEDELVYIEMRADGFLYHMARMITGTLIRVGLGKLNPREVADILANRDSMKGGPAAPARGLFLDRIEYPEDTLDC